MAPQKQCRTCRHYQPSPMRGQGWCRNPLLHLPSERHLVSGRELACDRQLHDYWEPIPPPEPSARGDKTPRTPRQLALVGVVALVVFAGIGYAASPLISSTLAEPTVAPTTPPPTPTSAPTAPPTQEPPAVQQVKVDHTGGEGAYIRTEPKTGAQGIVAWPDGTVLEVSGQATEESGRVWLEVKDDQGHAGWIPQEYTSPVGNDQP